MKLKGCLAGPVVSAAVILKNSINLKILRDSKKFLSKRQEISEHIRKYSHFAIGIASVEEIFSLNILQASLLSMKKQFNFCPLNRKNIDRWQLCS